MGERRDHEPARTAPGKPPAHRAFGEPKLTASLSWRWIREYPAPIPLPPRASRLRNSQAAEILTQRAAAPYRIPLRQPAHNQVIADSRELPRPSRARRTWQSPSGFDGRPAVPPRAEDPVRDLSPGRDHRGAAGFQQATITCGAVLRPGTAGNREPAGDNEAFSADDTYRAPDTKKQPLTAVDTTAEPDAARKLRRDTQATALTPETRRAVQAVTGIDEHSLKP